MKPEEGAMDLPRLRWELELRDAQALAHDGRLAEAGRLAAKAATLAAGAGRVAEQVEALGCAAGWLGAVDPAAGLAFAQEAVAVGAAAHARREVGAEVAWSAYARWLNLAPAFPGLVEPGAFAAMLAAAERMALGSGREGWRAVVLCHRARVAPDAAARRNLSEAALDLARRDPPNCVFSLFDYLYEHVESLRLCGEAERARALLPELGAAAEEVGAVAVQHALVMSAQLADGPEALRLADQAVARAPDLGHDATRRALEIAADAANRIGHPQEALAYAERLAALVGEEDYFGLRERFRALGGMGEAEAARALVPRLRAAAVALWANPTVRTEAESWILHFFPEPSHDEP